MVSINQWFAQVWFARYKQRQRDRQRQKNHIARLEQMERREAPGGLVHVWMDDVLASCGFQGWEKQNSFDADPRESSDPRSTQPKWTPGDNQNSANSVPLTAANRIPELESPEPRGEEYRRYARSRADRAPLTSSDIIGSAWDDDSLGGSFSTGAGFRLNQQFGGGSGGGNDGFYGIFGPASITPPPSAPLGQAPPAPATIDSSGSQLASNLTTSNSSDGQDGSQSQSPADKSSNTNQDIGPISFEGTATAISADQVVVYGTLPDSVANETRVEIYRSTDGQLDSKDSYLGEAQVSNDGQEVQFRGVIAVDPQSADQLLLRLPHYPKATGTLQISEAPLEDQDNDGISDLIESISAHGGDGNRDGVADQDQDNVASFFSGSADYPVTIQANAGTLQNLTTTEAAEKPADRVSLPYGVFDFTVDDVEIGGITVVEITLPENARPSSYFKTNPSTGEWERFTFDGTTGAIIDDNKVYLYLQDGGRGDADGIANGVILDPGGPGVDDGVISLPGAVDSGLTGWTVQESGGNLSPGTVVELDGDIVLTEGDSFLVSLMQSVVIPENPEVLTFDFLATFENADDDFINDAFEVALVDQNGMPVVPVFQSNRDAFFNFTEDEAAATGSSTTYVNQTVELDISELAVGRSYDVVFRLINDDDDTTTTVTLIGQDNPIVAANDTFQVAEDSIDNVLDVLANDDGVDLAITAVGTAGGTVTIVDGKLEYSPVANYFGTDTFTYTITDSNQQTDTGQITILVTEVNDSPAATNDSFNVDEDNVLNITEAQLVSNDSAGPSNESSQTLSVTSVGTASHGTVALNLDGSVTYTPDPNYNGSDSFAYTVTDNGTTNGASDPLSVQGTVTVNVAPINDPPVAEGDVYAVSYDLKTGTYDPLSISTGEGVLSNDSDPDNSSPSLTAHLIQTTANGTLSLNSNGSFTYTPDSGFTGIDSFTYKAKDSSGAYSNVAEAQINVGAGNYTVPGDADKLYVLEVAIEFVNISASYRNELGLYLADNSDGDLGSLSPGDSGYAYAALTHPTSQVVFHRPTNNSDLNGATYQVIVPGGSQIAFYLAQNTTTQNIINNNTSNSQSGPHAFFTFNEANPDNEYIHFRTSTLANGKIKYNVEDLDGDDPTQDNDYNDLEFSIDASPVEVEGSLKFLVVDSDSDRVYYYTENGDWVGQPQLDSSNEDVRGITTTATGDYRWTVDDSGDVFVYDDEGSKIGQWTISGTVSPEGIATDGTNLWIVDAASDQVLYFAGAAAIGTVNELLSGTHSATSSFSLGTGNTSPTGITTDGTTIWVVDDGADKVFAYTASNGTLLGSWSLDSQNGNAGGITIGTGSGATSLWVVDSTDARVYHYANSTSATSGSRSATDTFDLGMGNFQAEGIADPVTEAGDSISTAYSASLSLGIETQFDGEIGDGSYGGLDVDMFKVYLNSGETLSADIDSVALDGGGSLAYGGYAHLRLFDSYGYEVADADYYGGVDPDSGYGGDPVLEYTSSYGGTYYLGVSADGNESYDANYGGSGYGGSTFDYQLEMNLEYGGAPEITVRDDAYGGSIILDDYGSYAFGSTPVNSDLTRTFQITNDGTDTLVLDKISVSSKSSFSLDSSFGTSSLAPGNSTTFVIRFDADAAGVYAAQISFGTNDSDEDPFNFDVSGTVTSGSSSDIGDTIYSAQSVSLSTGIQTQIDSKIGDGTYGGADVDMFQVYINSGETFSADIDSMALDGGGSLAYGGYAHLRLFDSYGYEVADADYYGGVDPDSGYGGDPVLEYTSSYGGIYYLGVSADGNESYDPNYDGSGYGGSTFDYQLELNLAYNADPEIDVSYDNDGYGGYRWDGDSGWWIV